MHNIVVEKRLQKLIDSDARKSNQIAAGTKILNKKLHFSNAAIDSKQSEIDNHTKQFLLSNERLISIGHLVEERQAELVRTKQQLSRMKKKKKENIMDDGTICHLSDADRRIQFKKMLKLSLLHRCTKLHFTELKTQQKIVKGYVSCETDVHPFEEKFNIPVASDEIQLALWNKIRLGSGHILEWNELFSDNVLEQVNLTVI